MQILTDPKVQKRTWIDNMVPFDIIVRLKAVTSRMFNIRSSPAHPRKRVDLGRKKDWKTLNQHIRKIDQNTLGGPSFRLTGSTLT